MDRIIYGEQFSFELTNEHKIRIQRVSKLLESKKENIGSYIDSDFLVDLGNLAEDFSDKGKNTVMTEIFKGFYDTALELDPNNIRALFNKVRVLYSQQQWESGEILINKIINNAPDNVRAKQWKSLYLLNKNQFEEAKKYYVFSSDQDFDKIYRITFPGTYIIQTKCLHDNTNESLHYCSDSAKTSYENAFKNAKNDEDKASYLESLGSTYQDLNQLNKAKESFQEALKLNPNLDTVRTKLETIFQSPFYNFY